MKPKMLIFGVTGNVGSAMKKAFENDYEVVGLHRPLFDATYLLGVAAHIENAAPEVVVNAVGYRGFDNCEMNPHRALTINTLFPDKVAGACEDLGIPFIHFSSDAATDRHDTVYGLTKYGGDCFVLSHRLPCWIIRMGKISDGILTSEEVAMFAKKVFDHNPTGIHYLTK